MIPINLSEQLLSGTFEFTLNELMDKQIDLSSFDQWYNNEKRGPKAFHPAVMLKIILYAYSKGILSSRKIEHACKTNIIFMALSGEATPDHSTIAAFVSQKSDTIKEIFIQVLAVCYQLDLIGLEYFAIDGCKLPSNAAKEHSGTFNEYKKKVQKLEKRIDTLLQQHQENDATPDGDSIQKAVESITKQKERIETFLKNNTPRSGSTGKEVKSNITDNDSAKIKTGEGYIQGYNGLAVTDSKHQIVVNAYPIGKQYEGDSFQPIVKDTLQTVKQAGILKKDIRERVTLLADSNYFSESNSRFVMKEEKIRAVIPDNQFRRRDPRFPAVKPQYSKKKTKKFSLDDFIYDPNNDSYTCPNGKTLSRYTKSSTGAYHGIKYRSALSDCKMCALRNKCLIKNGSRRTIFISKPPSKHENYARKMVDIIDSAEGRNMYSKRMGIVEPVFANIKNAKGMNRFTLRSLKKVAVQWLYYCLVHNIEKICTTGTINRLVLPCG
jgi:transposase